MKPITELGTVFLGDDPSKCCQRCGYPMTWDAQKRQYGRLLQRGFGAEWVKSVTPRCQKCVTVMLKKETPPKQEEEVTP